MKLEELEIAPDWTEDAAERTIEAFRLCRKIFPQFTAEEILAGIDLAIKNNGLYLYPASEPDTIFAFLRYHPGVPGVTEAIQSMEIEKLRALDLSHGPFLHILAFASPQDGYRMMREIIEALNPYACTYHRDRKNGKRVFTILRNARWRKQ